MRNQPGWLIWSKIAGWSGWLYFLAAHMYHKEPSDTFVWMLIIGTTYFVAYHQGRQSHNPTK